jgi:RNA polymerase sigma-70 factor (ECF subfamily)
MTTAAMTITPGRNHATDVALMRRVATHEPGALEELIGLYQPRIRRLTFRLLAWRGEVDDVVQDVFVTAFEKAAQYRGQASLWTWLTVITLNKSRTAMRRRTTRARLASLLYRYTVQTSAPPRTAESDELTAQVRSAVASLAPKDREVIVLCHLEGKTSAEVAKLLGLSPNTAEVRLHRARKRLRDRLHGFMKE